MAENKKSIIVYADWIELFESLSNEEAGLLIKHFFRYVNDLNPTAPDRITELSFIPLKQALKRDLDKWETTLEERSINGRKGNLKKYNPDLYIQFELGKYTLEEAELIAKSRKASLPDSVATKTLANVAVNDNVNVNDILIQPEVVIDWSALLNQFNELVGRNHKLVTEKAKRQLIARLKDGYTKQDIWNAIQNCYNDEYHKETNHKYLTLEFISRPDKMERYSIDVVKSKKIDKSEIGKL
jgi:uncharacterized phage protein (TIGR02220 family)